MRAAGRSRNLQAARFRWPDGRRRNLKVAVITQRFFTPSVKPPVQQIFQSANRSDSQRAGEEKTRVEQPKTLRKATVGGWSARRTGAQRLRLFGRDRINPGAFVFSWALRPGTGRASERATSRRAAAASVRELLDQTQRPRILVGAATGDRSRSVGIAAPPRRDKSETGCPLSREAVAYPSFSLPPKLGSSSLRISCRVRSNSTPSCFNTRAATLSPSCNSPSKMCSVPT